MKVYDCFPFFNELDLLEIRLNELNDIVDYFVLVEAERTFQNNSKPLYYLNASDEDRFSKFKDKIIHVVLSEDEFVDVDVTARPNVNEKYQWEMCVHKGLVSADDDDWILMGASDEIINSTAFLNFSPDFDKVGHYRFEQINFYHYLNTVFESTDRPPIRPGWVWYGTCLTTKKYLIQDPYEISESSRYGLYHNPINIIPEGGWHFSYLGNANANNYKLKNMVESEFSNLTLEDSTIAHDNLLDPLHRDNSRFAGYMPINMLPKFIQNNVTKFEGNLHQS